MSGQDRMDSIVFLMHTVDDCIERGDLQLANWNFAKLVESIRQQNEYLGNVNPNLVEDTVRNYKDFRTKYNLEYPKDFLPPQVEKDENSIKKNQNLYLTMYETMFDMYGMLTSEYLGELLKTKKNFYRNLNFLRKIKDTNHYELHIKKAIEFYNQNNKEHQIGVNEEQISCISNPEKFNEKAYYLSCLLNCFESFYYYWDSQLASLKRKDAIKKRLIYLLDKTNEYSNEAKRNQASLDTFEKIQSAINEYKDKIKKLKI